MTQRALKEKLIKIGAFIFLFYLVFWIGKVVYQNIKFNKIEKNLEREVEVLEAENANLKNKILYYQTDSFKERVMRERLQYQKPGEQVLVITTNSQETQAKDENKREKISNRQKWWNFLFPKKKDDL